MGRVPGTELYEYMPPSAGVREPEDGQAAFPYYLSDRPRPGIPSMDGRGPQGPDTNLRAVGKVITGAVMGGLGFGAAIWADPTLLAARYPNAPDPLKKLLSVLSGNTTWLRPRRNYIAHNVSKGSVHLNADLTHALDLLAVRLQQVVLNQAFMAADTAWLAGQLVTHKIPQIVQRYLRPIRIRLGRVERLAGEALLQVRALRTSTNRRLNRIQRTEIDPLKKPVRVTLPGRIHRVEQDVKTVKKQQLKVGHIVSLLTFLLVPTKVVPWLVKNLTRAGLGYTTCTNMKDVGNEICASPPGSGKRLGRWLRQLLSLAPGFLAFPFICQIIGSVVALAGTIVTPLVEVLAEAGAALCDGKHSQAPDLPLETHALPPNPLGLSIS